MNWKSRFFKLTPRELQYYDKDILKGSIKLDGAIVKSDEKSSTHEITIKSKSGVTIVVRAPSSEHRGIWVTTMDEQISAIEQKVANAAMQFSAEDHALTMKDGDQVGIIEIPSVALSEAEGGGDLNSSQKSKISLAEGFNGGPGSQSLMSAFLTRKPAPVPARQPEAVNSPPPPPVPRPSGSNQHNIQTNEPTNQPTNQQTNKLKFSLALSQDIYQCSQHTVLIHPISTVNQYTFSAYLAQPHLTLIFQTNP